MHAHTNTHKLTHAAIRATKNYHYILFIITLLSKKQKVIRLLFVVVFVCVRPSVPSSIKLLNYYLLNVLLSFNVTIWFCFI